MILGLVSFASGVACMLAFTTLVITGGPLVWIATFVTVSWLGAQAWRWLDVTVPADAETVLPADHR